MIEQLQNFIGRSHWKAVLLESLYLAPENRLYQKDLMFNKSGGTCMSLGRHINELIEMGVITKTKENNKVILSINDNWRPIFVELIQIHANQRQNTIL